MKNAVTGMCAGGVQVPGRPMRRSALNYSWTKTGCDKAEATSEFYKSERRFEYPDKHTLPLDCQAVFVVYAKTQKYVLCDSSNTPARVRRPNRLESVLTRDDSSKSFVTRTHPKESTKDTRRTHPRYEPSTQQEAQTQSKVQLPVYPEIPNCSGYEAEPDEGLDAEHHPERRK